MAHTVELDTLTLRVKGYKILYPRAFTDKWVHLCGNIMKQKWWNTPDLEGQVRSD